MTKKSEVVQCSWLEDHQHSIKKPRGSQGGEEARGEEGQPKSKDGGKGAEGEIQNGQKGNKRFEDEGERECNISRRGLDCTVKIYRSEESEERVTVLRIGTQHWGQFQE